MAAALAQMKRYILYAKREKGRFCITASITRTFRMVQVVRIIDNEAVPLLKRCSLAGHATLKSPARVFTDHPLAADMCIDILSDRGMLACMITYTHTCTPALSPCFAVQG